MAGFSPRFCTIHLKIHVCPDANVTSKLKAQEDAIGYKIRRLHGNQTEEDKMADQDRFNRTNKEGSITSLLARAKATNAKQREDTGINDDDMEHGPLVSEDNIIDRMARLRNRSLGINAPEAPKPTPKPVEVKKVETPKPVAKLAAKLAAKPAPKSESYNNTEQITESLYSQTEVTQMITEAVEIALTKFVNLSKKPKKNKAIAKPMAKKVVVKPTPKPVAKKTIAKPTPKPVVKKVTNKAAANKPVAKKSVKPPIKSSPIKKKK